MSLEDRPGFTPRPTRPRSTGPRPVVCQAIVAACASLYLYEVWRSGSINDPDNFGALNAAAIRAGDWWRLVTNVFEHRDLIHLGLNMSVVFSLGMTFERALGHRIIALVSVITALGSNLAVLRFAPPESYTVGASGMIVGWAGALLPLATESFRQSLRQWVVQVAIISILPGVSWQAHLGGFLAGLACGYTLKVTS
jgi:membrane associated rhomboid family serine protease